MKANIILGALLGALLTAATSAAPAPVVAASTAMRASALPSIEALPQPTLPTIAAVDAALRGSPSVEAARALRDAASRNGDVLRIGNQEVNVQVQTQSRRVGAGPDAGRYGEWQILVSRPLRWPGQAAADAAVAESGASMAAVGVGDAAHEARRQLLQLWFDARRASALAALQERSAALMQQQRDAMQRRRALGDASQMELDQIDAETALEWAQARLARGRASAAEALLRTRMPLLDDAPIEPVDVSPGASDDALIADVLAHNPTLALARASVREARALAAQADALRTPQPTVGMYVGNERGGAERLVGVQIGVALGSGARSARADAQAAAARAAQWHATDVEQRLRAQLRAALAQRDALRASAAALLQAGTAQALAADRLQRAYALGEAGLGDWLQQRRRALQSIQELMGARFDAAMLSAQLRLDAGLLWRDDSRTSG